MPEFLIDKLKKYYGQDSKIPYAIANSRGLMQGSKITSKGRALQRKHDRDVAARKAKK